MIRRVSQKAMMCFGAKEARRYMITVDASLCHDTIAVRPCQDVLKSSLSSGSEQVVSKRFAARTRVARCESCGGDRPLAQMRFPGQSRGVTPRTCQDCRANRPDQAWCDSCSDWHSRSAFTTQRRRPAVHRNRCTESMSAEASEKRGLPPRLCPSCDRILPTHRFSGGRQKSVICKDCRGSRVGLSWCRAEGCWLPLERFTMSGKGSLYPRANCNPCHTAASHGVTVAKILKRQGAEAPVCMACGTFDVLHVHHDHSHCPGRGCDECVQGYLCHVCNTAEGLFRTAERAARFADWMGRRRESAYEGAESS